MNDIIIVCGCYRELESRSEILSIENVELIKIVNEADRTIDKLNNELKKTRLLVVDLTKQLSDSFEARRSAIVSGTRYIL